MIPPRSIQPEENRPFRVALFTCYAPNIGGGGVNLRTLINHLNGIDVHWFHLGEPVPEIKHTSSLGITFSGGPLLSDLVSTPLWWVGAARKKFDEMARQLIELNADCHWVLAMNEGIPFALRLRKLAPNVPLHVSIQDDQEHGLYARSSRYRWFSRLTRRPFRQLLKTARSIDVTSDGMREYYQKNCGIESTVLHPVISLPSSESLHPQAASLDQSALTIGHIGTVYRSEELLTLLQATADAAQSLGKTPKAIFIGLAEKYHVIAQTSGVDVQLYPHQTESSSILILRNCDAVYAMYPFDSRSAVFRRTSLPTKITTYLKVARPVIAHAPDDSTLVDAVNRFGIGAVSTERTSIALARAIMSGVSNPPVQRAFDHMATTWYGEHNAVELQRLLTAKFLQP